jgi:hypothetical protein
VLNQLFSAAARRTIGVAAPASAQSDPTAKPSTSFLDRVAAAQRWGLEQMANFSRWETMAV